MYKFLKNIENYVCYNLKANTYGDEINGIEKYLDLNFGLLER